MAKVTAICGKICSGKTICAKRLAGDGRAVILSCDEITSDIFDNSLNEKHDEFTERIRKYLMKKAAEIASAGTDVILDWGFWTRKYRDYTRSYFAERNIAFEIVYIDISDGDWLDNINKRNALVSQKLSTDYYVDSGLISKLNALFETPSRDEIDIWQAFCPKEES